MVETLFPAAPQKRRDFIQDLANHGCYVKQSEKGFAINKGWKYVDINKQLHLWFPQVFKHLDSQCQGIPTVSDAKPDWQLLCCDGRPLAFSVMKTTYLDADTLQTYKGRSKAGIAGSHLWFGTSLPQSSEFQSLILV